VFLLLLLFASQVLFDLYARSVVTAAAYDAARIVAGADADGGADRQAVTDAESTARAQLGARARPRSSTGRSMATSYGCACVAPTPACCRPRYGGRLESTPSTVRSG